MFANNRWGLMLFLQNTKIGYQEYLVLPRVKLRESNRDGTRVKYR